MKKKEMKKKKREIIFRFKINIFNEEKTEKS